MKAFVSWSSGKDCMYALYKFLQQKDNEVIALLNMTNADSDKSRSHGITNEMVLRQAAQLSFPLVQQPAGKSDYEANFKKAVEALTNVLPLQLEDMLMNTKTFIAPISVL